MHGSNRRKSLILLGSVGAKLLRDQHLLNFGNADDQHRVYLVVIAYLRTQGCQSRHQERI